MSRLEFQNPLQTIVAQPWPAVNETVPELAGHYQAPVKAVEVLNAVSMTEPAKGIYIYDMGQEVAGILRKVKWKKRRKSNSSIRRNVVSGFGRV